MSWRRCPLPLLSLLPLSSPPPAVLRLPLSPLCVSGEEEGHAHVPGVVELAWSEEEVANLMWIGSPSWFVDSIYYFSMLPSPVWSVCGVWVALGWSIPWVYLSTRVTTTVHVATPEEASTWSVATLSRPVASSR
ncbi:hypothetical protein Taro_027580 [Colocasia esculenta]|uniref:Uncharacterized protein n=1 Tax=Colocasia esculenta TaxID=4460 RepID=A0A843VKJ3_COLES|nr:hypothetical protein [Colocasia esculenta]